MISAYDNLMMDPHGKESSDHDRWRKLINRSINKRARQMKMWREIKKYLSMDGYKLSDHNIDEVRINRCRAFERTLLANISYKSPRITMKARPGSASNPFTTQDGRQIDPHQVTEFLVNYITSQHSFGFSRKLRRFLRAGARNIGVVYIGHEANFGDGYETPDLYAFDEETDNFLQDGDGNYVKVKSSRFGRKMPVAPTDEWWYIENIPASRALFDPDGEEEFHDHAFVAAEYWVPYDELLASDKYDGFNRGVIKRLVPSGQTRKYEPIGDMPEGAQDEAGDDYDFGDEPDEDAVRVIRIHDAENRVILHMAEGADDFLSVEDYPKWIKRFPYVTLRFDEEEMEFYQRPLHADLVPVSQAMDAANELDMATRRANIPKAIIRSGAFDEKQLAILNSPIPQECAMLEEGQGPEGAVTPIPRPGMMMDSITIFNRLQQGFDEVAGQSINSRGGSGIDLATEATIISNGQQVKSGDIRAVLQDAVTEVAKILTDCIEGTMTKKHAVSIVLDGDAFSEEVSSAGITADVECEVRIEDMIPRSSDMEQMQLERVMATLGQYSWLAESEALLEEWLDRCNITNGKVRKEISTIAKRIRDEKAAAAAAQAAAQQAQGANQPGVASGQGSLPQMLSAQGGAM